MTGDTTSEDFFEAKYRAHRDPWNFASSPYELGRYETTLKMLEGRRYVRAFEPGCSIGVLTAQLAAMCDEVEAIDISPMAVEQARERCGSLRNVRVSCAALPDGIPRGAFDLMILSEIGYYFAGDAWAGLGKTLVQRLRTSGTLVAAHWLGTSADHLLTGDQVHEILGGLEGLVLETSERHSGFRLDRWSRV